MKATKPILRHNDSIKSYATTQEEVLSNYNQFKPETLAAIKKAYLNIGELNLSRANRRDIKNLINVIPINKIREEISLQIEEDNETSRRSSISQQQIAMAEATAKVYRRISLLTLQSTAYCGEHAYLLLYFLISHGIDASKVRCVEVTANKVTNNAVINHVFVIYNDSGFEKDLLPSEIKNIILQQPEKIILMNPWGCKKLIVLNDKASLDLLNDLLVEIMEDLGQDFHKNSLAITLDSPIQFYSTSGEVSEFPH